MPNFYCNLILVLTFFTMSKYIFWNKSDKNKTVKKDYLLFFGIKIFYN